MNNTELKFYNFVNNNKELLGLDLNTAYSKPPVGFGDVYLTRIYLSYIAGRLDESKTMD